MRNRAICIHFGRTTEFEALVNRYEAVIHPGLITIISCINQPGVTYVEQMVQYCSMMYLSYWSLGGDTYNVMSQ